MSDLDDLQPASADLPVEATPADLKAVCHLVHRQEQGGSAGHALGTYRGMLTGCVQLGPHLPEWLSFGSYLLFITSDCPCYRT
jgi:hypothetical protein